jgi:hypothetical protein
MDAVDIVIENPPAGFEYLDWRFVPDSAGIDFGGASGSWSRESASFMISSGPSPAAATIHVWNCDSAGNLPPAGPAMISESFKVQVK